MFLAIPMIAGATYVFPVPPMMVEGVVPVVVTMLRVNEEVIIGVMPRAVRAVRTALASGMVNTVPVALVEMIAALITADGASV